MSSAGKAEKLGYTNVKIFADGMPAWKKAGNLTVSSVSNLKSLVEKDVPHVLIDIRPADTAKTEHIKNSVSLPLEEIAGSQKKFPDSKKAPIILYSNDEKLSEEAFGMIRKRGYVNLSYLEGGLDAWKGAGHALDSGDMKTVIVYSPKPGHGEIMPDDFRKIAGGTSDGKLVLDVRDAEETAGGMIKGAINIPAQEISDKLAEIPKDREILTHCSTGTRAEIAYNVLKEKGYRTRFLNATVKIGSDGSYEIIKED